MLNKKIILGAEKSLCKDLVTRKGPGNKFKDTEAENELLSLMEVHMPP